MVVLKVAERRGRRKAELHLCVTYSPTCGDAGPDEGQSSSYYVRSSAPFTGKRGPFKGHSVRHCGAATQLATHASHSCVARDHFFIMPDLSTVSTVYLGTSSVIGSSPLMFPSSL